MVMKLGTSFVELVTEDVSFRGVFAFTDEPVKVGQLVPIELWLPPKGTSFAVSAKVVHDVHRRRLSGVGLEFYAVGRSQQILWDNFIEGLRRDFPAIAGRASRIARASRFDPLRKRDASQVAVLRIEVQTALDLQIIYQRDVPKGGLFVLTDEELEPGDYVGLQLIHPNTDDVFELAGVVARHVVQQGIRGLGIDFVDLDEERVARLHDFVHDGLADLFDDESIDLQHSS
jgi:Tfp pilus assembly protein PilZ